MGRPHTPESKEKITAAKSGKPLSAEHRAAISAASRGKPKTAEHKAKIGAAHLGRVKGPHTPEHNAKISASGKAYGPRPKTPEHIAKIAAAKRGKPLGPWSPERRARLSALLRGKKKRPFTDEHKAKLVKSLNRRGPSSLEKMVGNVLNDLQIPNIPQAPLGWYHVDFLLPEHNLVLECDGVYWHSQPQAILNDQRRDTWLTRHGYIVLRIPEHEIIHDVRTAVVHRLVSYYRL